jgi:2-polyprenyl-3-methyl-5-hydroxy-6-metoxy-1,4-benzoquinol methylase
MHTPVSIIKSVRPSLTQLRILDIGCGTGALVRQFVFENADVCGIDPNARAVQEAATAVPQAKFYAGTAQDLPFESERFDIAVMV